ncbi:hypothetical protein N0V88_003098 [Collariella sp. IMI 366227]|nr:hypothetical protein N0V88_003098 [Collariella sp. IMI 366227]
MEPVTTRDTMSSPGNAPPAPPPVSDASPDARSYRTALNTYKESAAAWGAVLGAIPGLDALIEGHLRGSGGKAIISSIKDSNQQDTLVARWQDSSVFRAFFGHNGPPPALQAAEGNISPAILPQEVEVEEEEVREETPLARPPPAKRVSQPPKPEKPVSIELATRASQTLTSLGFAPDETIADFYSMGSNPEPIPEPADPEFDPSLGSEAEQRAFYELLMGRSFPG